MEDREVLGRIGELVDEEHGLYHRAEKGGPSAREHERLRQLEVNLDQCWDLLRQRRALREVGYDPNEAKVKDEKTIEGYLQ
jgi:hypothetical protein